MKLEIQPGTNAGVADVTLVAVGGESGKCMLAATQEGLRFRVRERANIAPVQSPGLLAPASTQYLTSVCRFEEDVNWLASAEHAREKP